MRKFIYALTAIITVGLVAPAATAATVEEDIKSFQGYYTSKFPGTPFNDFINGVYSIDSASREQWEAIEEFAPYEIDIEKGEEMWNTPFANGKTYGYCFGGPGVRHNYPHFDKESGKIKTLEGEINACRTANGEKPLKWKKGKIASLTAYMAFESRGNTFNTEVPNDERALAAYEKGKKHFYMKRGQLNLACADCHMFSAGSKVRADLLSPALGHLTHFPVYRSKWGSLGTPHRRFGGCNKQVRAKPFKAQSEEYNTLEYFINVMATGLEANGPGARK